MSTKFYRHTSKGRFSVENPGIPIGTRRSAGLYCWDCDLTLCKGGNEAIHKNDNDSSWHKKCPKCGKKPIHEDLTNSTMGRELGFNKNKPQRKTGVSSCCSFRWEVSPETIINNKNKKLYIFDEYGDKYTIDEFKQVLDECPVEYPFDGDEDDRC